MFGVTGPGQWVTLPFLISIPRRKYFFETARGYRTNRMYQMEGPPVPRCHE